MARRLAWIAVWLLILSPSLIYLVDLPHFGSVPRNDYYAVLAQITDGSQLKLDPWTLLTIRSNEHTVTLPALAFALNIALTRGDNRGLSALSLLLLAVLVLLLFRLLPADLRRSAPAALLLGLLLSILVFTPVAAHNVVLGFSGTMWFLSNVLAVAATLALWVRAPGNGRLEASFGTWSLWPVAFLGLLGAFTYSTNLTLWPGLVVGALLLGVRWKRLLVPMVAGGLVLLHYALTYDPPGHHPELESGFLVLIRFLGIYLGSLFASDSDVAMWFGFLGLVAGGLFAVVVGRGDGETRRLAAPWLVIQIYALGNALGTASARSGFGERYALASRYANIEALFWIGLLVPAGILLWRGRSTVSTTRLVQFGTCALLVSFLFLAMYQRGVPFLRGLVRSAGETTRGEMAVRYGVRDDEAVRSFARWPPAVWQVAEYLRQSGHVPFGRPQIDPARVARDNASRVQGYFDKIEPVEGLAARVYGWAFSPREPVEGIVLLNDRGEVLGEAVHGNKRGDVAAVLGAEALPSGWMGYARMSDESERVTAYVKLAGEPGLLPLNGGRTLAGAAPARSAPPAEATDRPAGRAAADS